MQSTRLPGAGRQLALQRPLPPFAHDVLARFGRLRLLPRPPLAVGKPTLIERAFSGPRPGVLLGLALLAGFGGSPTRAFAEPAAQAVVGRPDLLKEVTCLRRYNLESRRLALVCTQSVNGASLSRVVPGNIKHHVHAQEKEKDAQQAQQQIASLVAELCAARLQIKSIKAAAEEDKLDWERDFLCVVCMDGPRAVTYGCGHHVTCQGCDAVLQRRREIDKCPTCRTPITQRVAHLT